MIYRLKELKGDTIAVPQLVFSKLGIAEEYNVRVALYVLATGVTDPDKICADLKLRSRISAESALAFWAGAGLLERYEENAAPGADERIGRITDGCGRLLSHPDTVERQEHPHGRQDAGCRDAFNRRAVRDSLSAVVVSQRNGRALPLRRGAGAGKRGEGA